MRNKNSFGGFFRLSFVVAFCLIVSALSFAASNLNIVVVDMDYIISNSTAGKKANEDIKTKQDADAKYLQGLEEKIDNISSTLKNGGDLMDAKKKTDLVNSLREYQSQYQSSAERSQQELMEMRGRLSSEVVQQIMGIVKDYVKKNKIDLVLNANPSLTIYYDDKLNISSEILKTYEEKSKSQK